MSSHALHLARARRKFMEDRRIKRSFGGKMAFEFTGKLMVSVWNGSDSTHAGELHTIHAAERTDFAALIRRCFATCGCSGTPNHLLYSPQGAALTSFRELMAHVASWRRSWKEFCSAQPTLRSADKHQVPPPPVLCLPLGRRFDQRKLPKALMEHIALLTPPPPDYDLAANPVMDAREDKAPPPSPLQDPTAAPRSHLRTAPLRVTATVDAVRALTPQPMLSPNAGSELQGFEGRVRPMSANVFTSIDASVGRTAVVDPKQRAWSAACALRVRNPKSSSRSVQFDSTSFDSNPWDDDAARTNDGLTVLGSPSVSDQDKRSPPTVSPPRASLGWLAFPESPERSVAASPTLLSGRGHRRVWSGGSDEENVPRQATALVARPGWSGLQTPVRKAKAPEIFPRRGRSSIIESGRTASWESRAPAHSERAGGVARQTAREKAAQSLPLGVIFNSMGERIQLDGGVPQPNEIVCCLSDGELWKVEFTAGGAAHCRKVWRATDPRIAHLVLAHSTELFRLAGRAEMPRTLSFLTDHCEVIPLTSLRRATTFSFLMWASIEYDPASNAPRAMRIQSTAGKESDPDADPAEGLRCHACGTVGPRNPTCAPPNPEEANDDNVAGNEQTASPSTSPPTSENTQRLWIL